MTASELRPHYDPAVSNSFFVILIFFFFAAPAIVGHYIGKDKGRTGWMWGLLLSWIGVLIVALFPPVDTPVVSYDVNPPQTYGPDQLGAVAPGELSRSEFKVCPDCAEQVKFEAKICRFCRHEFERCPECAEFLESKERCTYCGYDLSGNTMFCVDCDAVVPSSATACSECGATFASEA